MIFKVIPNFLKCYSSIILLDVLGSFGYEIFLDIFYNKKIDFFDNFFFIFIIKVISKLFQNDSLINIQKVSDPFFKGVLDFATSLMIFYI